MCELVRYIVELVYVIRNLVLDFAYAINHHYFTIIIIIRLPVLTCMCVCQLIMQVYLSFCFVNYFYLFNYTIAINMPVC